MTKMAYFIPCLKSTSAPDFAKLFISHIDRLHGLPNSSVPDRGSIFTSNFWSTLASILQIDPRKSTTFHAQTDGQTKRMNQTLEQYLFACIVTISKTIVRDSSLSPISRTITPSKNQPRCHPSLPVTAFTLGFSLKPSRRPCPPTQLPRPKTLPNA